MKAATRHELEFASGQEVLVGDLVTPLNVDNFPTVLILAGYGPSDRHQRFVRPDGKIMSDESKGWLAYGLAELRIATFAWDKRGLGASSGGDREPNDPPGDRDSQRTVQEHRRANTCHTWRPGFECPCKRRVSDSQRASIVRQHRYQPHYCPWRRPRDESRSETCEFRDPTEREVVVLRRPSAFRLLPARRRGLDTRPTKASGKPT